RTRLAEIAMPERERYAERAAGVSRRGLDPEIVERPFAQDAPVGDAVERHAAGEAELGEAGLLPRVLGHLQHDLFGDLLDRAREIHLALGEEALRFARRSAEELVEPAV